MKNVFLLLILSVVLSQTVCEIDNPVHCGFDGITEQMCVDRGCCYKEGSNPTCFYPNLGKGNITKVHVVHGCHFDAGFVDTTVNIVNRYFDEIYPRVYTDAVSYEKEGGNVQMRFTTQSWLLSLFFDCPPGLGIHCPSEESIRNMNTCIEKDWITWHAFPHVAELEIMDESSIQFGIHMSNELRKRFNKPESHFISQNDVPGTTSAAIPILKKNGILAFRQGVNVVSQPPNVPNIYLWKDPTSGETILNLNHRNGYGGWRSMDEMVVIPGYNEAMLVAFNDDNQGPYTSGWLRSIFSAAKNFFPQASVVASSFDEFITGASEYVNSHPESLPVLEREIGDTWLYGCSSDPKKIAMMRIINRARTECEEQQRCSYDDQRYYNFSRLFMFNGEHTWGGDIKGFLHDTENWTNKDFHQCLADKKDNYIATVGTWEEQRHWGFDAPLEALQDHELHEIIDKEIDVLNVKEPSLEGYSVIENVENIELDHFVVSIDKQTGGLSRLQAKDTQREWCDEKHEIGYFQYDVYNTTDYDNYLHEYFIVWNEWGPQDFGKPNLDKVHHVSESFFSEFVNAYMKKGETEVSIIVEMIFNETLSELYGTPKKIYQQYTFPTATATINLDSILIDKTATRIPESLFTVFNVIPNEKDTQYDGWFMDKLGESIQINQLDMQKTRGNAHQHGILSGFEYSYNKDYIKVNSLDAGIIVTGKPTGFPCPFNTPDLSYGVSTMLVNNLWGVNYVMWYPFEEEDANLLFRYSLEFNKN